MISKASPCLAHLYSPDLVITVNSSFKVLKDQLSGIEYNLSNILHRDSSLLLEYSSLLQQSVFKDLFRYSKGYALYDFDLESLLNKSIVACSLLRVVEENPSIVSLVLSQTAADPSVQLVLMQTLIPERNHAIFNPLSHLAGLITSECDVEMFLDLIIEDSSTFLDPEESYITPEAKIKQHFVPLVPEEVEKEFLLERSISTMLPYLTAGIWKENKYG